MQIGSLKPSFKHLIFIVSGVSILLLLILFFINNAVAMISVDGAQTNGQLVTSVIKNGKKEKIGGAGLVVIPRGSNALEVSAGNYTKTVTDISLPWYGFLSKSISLLPSKNAEKMAFAAPAELCPTYSSSEDALLRYNCAQPTSLIQFKTPDNDSWGDREVAKLSYIQDQTLPQYLGGVIGISIGDNDASNNRINGINIHIEQPVKVQATSMSGTYSYDTPGGVRYDNLADLRIMTDSTSVSNSHFLLIDKFGTVYLASVSDDKKTLSYKTVSSPDSYNYKYNKTACTIKNDSAFCYRGRNSDVIKDGDTALTQAIIEKLSFTDGLVSSSKVHDTPFVDSLYRAGDHMYVRSGKDIYSVIKNNNEFETKNIVRGVNSIASSQDSLYFVYDDALYVYNFERNQSYQVFYSSNIKTLGAYPVDGKVFVFGTAKHGDTTVYAYKLTDNKYASDSVRLLDILPLAYDAIDGLPINDFVGDRIFLQPATDGPSNDDIVDNFVNTVSSLGVEISKDNIQIQR